MKMVVAALFAIVLPLSAHAADQDRNLLEDTIKKEVASILKGKAVDEALKEFDKEVTQQLTDEFTVAKTYHIIKELQSFQDSNSDAEKALNGAILAVDVYNVFANTEDRIPYANYLAMIKDILDYSKASTEQQKYFVVLQTGGQVLTAIFPPYGIFFELAVIGHEMTDQYVRQHYLPSLQSMEADNKKLADQLIEKRLRRAQAELAYVRSMLLEVSFNNRAAEVIASFQGTTCASVEGEDAIARLVTCGENLKRTVYLSQVASRTLHSLLSTKFEILQPADINKVLNLKDGELESLAANMDQSIQKIQKLSQDSDQSTRDLVFQVEDAKIAIQEADRQAVGKCLQDARTKILPLAMRLESDEPISLEERASLAPELSVAQTVFDEECSRLKPNVVPPPTARLLKSYSTQLSEGRLTLAR